MHDESNYLVGLQARSTSDVSYCKEQETFPFLSFPFREN